MSTDNSFEMLQVVAKRNVQTAWLRVAAAAIVVIAGMTWFWVTIAPMANLVGFAVAFIVAYVIIASQVKNLSHARARAQKVLSVLILMVLASAGSARAHEPGSIDRQPLMTFDTVARIG